MTLDYFQHSTAARVGRASGGIFGTGFLRFCPRKARHCMRVVFHQVSFLVSIGKSVETHADQRDAIAHTATPFSKGPNEKKICDDCALSTGSA